MNADTKRAWIRTLEQLRFDVSRREPLQAHKEITITHAITVTLDESGHIRMVITRQVGETKRAQRKSRAGREYVVFTEQNAVTIINYRLRAEDDLATVLTEIEKEIAVG